MGEARDLIGVSYEMGAAIVTSRASIGMESLNCSESLKQFTFSAETYLFMLCRFRNLR